MTIELNQLDLFDALPESEKPEVVKTEKEKKEEEKKAAAEAKRAAAAKKVAREEEAEPDEYEVDRQVWYAGQRIDVPSRTMKKEDVRAWLEQNYFPELTKERCEMVYDKDKAALIPVLKGHRKGSQITVFLQEPNSPLPVYHLMDRHGTVWEVRNTQTGEFRAKLDGQGIEVVGHTLKLNVPRIPLSCLDLILDRFKHQPEIEHLAFIVWDICSGYNVVWPEQSATSMQVESEGFMETEDRFIVAHIHSHGRLRAFWSTTDDADEIRTGLYGVVGEVNTSKPTLKFRYSCGGKFVDIAPQAIFSGTISEVVRAQ